MHSIADMMGSMQSSDRSLESLAATLRCELDTTSSFSQLIDAADAKIEGIQASVVGLQNLARIFTLDSQSIVQACEFACDMKQELRCIQENASSASPVIRFQTSSATLEKLRNVNEKLTEIYRKLRLVEIVGNVIPSKIEHEYLPFAKRGTRSNNSNMNELAWLLNRVLSSKFSVQAATLLLETIREKDSRETKDVSALSLEPDSFGYEHKPFVHFLVGKFYYLGSRVHEKNRACAARFLHAAFNGGFISASYLLGKIYQAGEEVPLCHKKAFRFFATGARYRDAASTYELGRCFDFGFGTEIDGKKGYEYHKKAALLGSGEAMCMAGYHCLHGNSSTRNWPQAVRLLKKARKAGASRASYHLAYCYEHGIVVDKNPRMAYLLAQEAHEEGIDLAPYRLAMAYERGLGVRRDDSKAANFYRKMKNVPQLGALYQSYYGLCLIQGKGVQRNVKLGLRIVREGLKIGHGCGWSVYGDCFRHGYGSKKDTAKALTCYSKAITSHSGARGVADAHYSLAEMYEKGIGLEQNTKKAAHHYICAADRMVQNAQWKAGSYFEAGNAVEKHIYKAFYYFDLAARSGHVPSQRKATKLYMKGRGIERTRVKSSVLFEKESADHEAAILRTETRR